MLPQRLQSIDETSRPTHHFLEEEDKCWYFGEYFAGKGYTGGPTNQLIFNYKTKPTVAAQDQRRAYYKQQAIQEIATGLRSTISKNSIEKITWVPIPTSKMVGHPDYCDRLIRTLTRAFQGYDADVRPLLRQTQNAAADHESAHRTSYDDLSVIVEIDQQQLQVAPIKERIALFDDVLTSGKHFKVCQRKLQEQFPGVVVIGLFVARCIHANPFDD